MKKCFTVSLIFTLVISLAVPQGAVFATDEIINEEVVGSVPIEESVEPTIDSSNDEIKENDISFRKRISPRRYVFLCLSKEQKAYLCRN